MQRRLRREEKKADQVKTIRWMGSAKWEDRKESKKRKKEREGRLRERERLRETVKA